MINTCNRCGRQIVTAWRTAKGNYYHPHCLTCAICDVVIETEEQLEKCNLKEIYCKQCYSEYFGPLEESTEEILIPYLQAMNGESVPFMQHATPLSPSFSEFMNMSHLKSRSESQNANHSTQELVMKNTDTSGDHPSTDDDDIKRNDDPVPVNFKCSLSTMLKYTKPLAFTKAKLTESSRSQIFPSKIPKWKSNPKLSSQLEAVTISNTQSNSGLNKFLPKPCQNLIRAKSFHVPQQIRSKMNDYINSKGLKFANKPITPVLQNPQKRQTPFKALHVPLSAHESKKTINHARLNFQPPNKSHSMVIPNNKKSSSVQMKLETNLSNFKMPSFMVPKLKSTTGASWNSNFQQSSKSPPSSFLRPRVPTPVHLRVPSTLNHYLLPQEIMNRSGNHVVCEKRNGDGKQMSFDNKHKSRINTSISSASSYFGSTPSTSTRAIEKRKEGSSMRSLQFNNKQKIKMYEQPEPTDGQGGENYHGALDCPICLEKLINLHVQQSGESKENVVTCCGHIFHKECIHNWLNTNGNGRCPTCSKLCLKESIIPVYIEANISDTLNIQNADNEKLKALLYTLRKDYKQLREKHQTLLKEHNESRFAINDSLRSAYEMESRTRGQLQWENKLLHQKLEEMRTMIGIEQGDSFHTQSTIILMDHDQIQNSDVDN